MDKNLLSRMAKIIFACLLLAAGLTVNAAEETITVDGRLRTYKLHVPANPKGIIVALHGLGGTSDFYFSEYPITDFADQHRCIILAPQALPEQNEDVKTQIGSLGSLAGINVPLTAVWGCGMNITVSAIPWVYPSGANFKLNDAIDDVKFIRQMIDKTLADYSLPTENIFMLGVSMGGFMTYQYAEKYPEQLTGIISIAGSRGLAIDGANSLPLPVLDFHSMQDGVVPYAGSVQSSTAVMGVFPTVGIGENKTDVINYWVNRNGANKTAATENVTNYPSSKNISVSKYTYAQAQGKDVIHYKMDSPTAGFPGHDYFFSKAKGDCMDYYEEIAKFIVTQQENSTATVLAPEAVVTAYYDIMGRQLTQEPEKGIYIILYDNGKAEKVMK